MPYPAAKPDREAARCWRRGILNIVRGKLILGLLGVAAATPAKVDFTREIQPIFEKSCYACHGTAQQLAGLRLDSPAGVFRVVRPGKAAEQGGAAGLGRGAEAFLLEPG